MCRLSGNPNDAYLSSARYVLNVSTMRYLSGRYRVPGRGEVGWKGEEGGGGGREGLEQRGEARKLAGIGVESCIGGRNEVERLRPDASLTMSNRTVYLQACQTLARTHHQHPSNAAQESARRR